MKGCKSQRFLSTVSSRIPLNIQSIQIIISRIKPSFKAISLNICWCVNILIGEELLSSEQRFPTNNYESAKDGIDEQIQDQRMVF